MTTIEQMVVDDVKWILSQSNSFGDSVSNLMDSLMLTNGQAKDLASTPCREYDDTFKRIFDDRVNRF